MNIKRSIASITVLAAVGIASVTCAETPTITGVTAQQRYPWNGKVDISYTVTGDIAEEAKQRALLTALKVTAIDRIANTTNMATQLSGDLSLEEGTHAIVWDMDAEGFPLPFKSSNVVFIVSCEITPAMYCVIDLSGGADATSYPVTYMAEPPSGGFNVDEYKTTKLVLRRIEAGTFIMGNDQSDESHRVILTKPFFCGIFEMTAKQNSLVMGWELPYGDTLPVWVTYNVIRGSSNGANWPSSSAVDPISFIGKLRTRTGLDFDLPTEAQWEYACRAGTTTTYYWGDSMNDGYAWYVGNSSHTAHPIGTKTANAWGLYDMSGNLFEWCLDRYGNLAYGTDPKGPSSGGERVVRGGYWCNPANCCDSSFRASYEPSNNYDSHGFRLVRTLQTADEEGNRLCCGQSTITAVDLIPDIRTAALTERIYYSSTWAQSLGVEATSVVEVNCETLNSTAGAGFIEWTPQSNGTYVLTHKVMSGGTQYGETLTAIFRSVSTATRTTEVPVPYVWLEAHDPGVVGEEEYEAYEASAKASAANGRKLWECYVLGLNPEVATNDFRIISFPMKADGTPDLNSIAFTPTQAEWNVPGAQAVLKGAATLDGEWQTVTEENKAGFRFFKVVVEVP